ncbi:LysR substrate-binding domain-containing protein [Halomonas sp. V046]|uniref:LysR substrate-binding domain-containing protein n=1 Tax=Halomonas sp. V046 TaxID=3459611 RepID=UPI0040447D8B
MRIDLRHLRAYVAVAELLHFRRAAERLNVAQPALSRTIVQLEDAIGEALLMRNNRQVQLTVPGEVFLEECYVILRQVDDAVTRTQRAGRGEIGRLSVGYTDFAITGGLPKILEGFRLLYPDVQFDMHFGSTAQQLQELTEDRLDIGFITGPNLTPGIMSLPIQEDRFIAVVSERHRLAGRSSIALAELATEPFILGNRDMWQHFRRRLDALCVEAGFLPRVAQEAFNSEGVFGFVASDFGVTVHLECAHNYVRKGVRLLPLEDVNASLVTEVAWKDQPLSAVQEAFLTSLKGMV